MTQRYFALGQLAGAPHTRYAVLSADCRTVIGTQVSRPEGVEVERPADLRWRLLPFIGAHGRIHTPYWHNVGSAALSRARDRSGEQPRRTTWRRSGRTAAPQ